MIKVDAIIHGAGVKLEVKSLKFPGGEVHVTVDPHETPNQLTIHALLKNSDDIMELLMVTDALKRSYPGCPIALMMPYVPYARQDRVNHNGEAHSIKVFANLINQQNYAVVMIQDPHSDVTSALLDRVLVEDPVARLEHAVKIIRDRHDQDPVLVSPDAGARKRTFKIAQELGGLRVISADKTRNTKTGEITGTVIQNGVLGWHPFLVVDDICDGGRTFIELAKVLPPEVPKYLYVTHGIFSKGVEPLFEHYRGIMTPNSWIGYEHGDGRVIRL